MPEKVRAHRFQPGRLDLLDQRHLPRETVWVSCTDAPSTAKAIADMVVRGAPAIGVAAAYGMALAARRARERGADLPRHLEEAASVLAGSRPTAVNLFWGIDRMQEAARAAARRGLQGETLVLELEAEACRIHEDDIARNRRMGAFGAALLPDRGHVLTHCNAGALATGGHGTALGVIRSAVEAGKDLHVWVDETRPYLQGARLTLYELMEEGIPATLITDNMAGYLMRQGKVDAVVVGTDRTAANGDVANKIGTYTLGVLCARHRVPLYVACPLSTLDLGVSSGDGIPIEERSVAEVVEVLGVPIAPEGAEAYHPAFDITPAELVTAIVTEAGIARPPYEESLRALVARDRQTSSPR